MHDGSSVPGPLVTRRNLLLALLIGMLLTGVYWFTYSGQYLSNDETALFDAVESLARRSNTRVNYTLNTRTLREYAIGAQPDTPLVDAEPMQIALAVPLFQLAEALPGVGMLHAVWLLNVLVCAATGSVMFLYARALGYGERTAVSAALLLGLGTIVWPYSKVFFREPLAMVLLFSAALCLEMWRERWRWRVGWVWFGGFLALFVMAMLTKEAALLSIPIFLIIALPRARLWQGWGRLVGWVVLVFGAGVIAYVVLTGVLQIIDVPRSYDIAARLRGVLGRQEFILYALGGYLVSPGRSLFVFSPVLLAALPGGWLLTRQRQWRQALTAVAALLAFAGGYALLRHENWFGGLSWGPRYLVPATPFVLLAALPVLERFWEARLSRLARYGLIGLVAASVWVQLNGVLISQTAYFEQLETIPGVVAWQGGTWQPALTPLAIIPGLLSHTALDFAWLRVGSAGSGLALLAFGLVVGAIILLRYWERREPTAGRAYWLTMGLVPLVVILALYGGLRSIHRDPAYLGDFDVLRELVDRLEARVPVEDIVVLSSPEYQDYILNYYRGEALVYTLPLSPGERPSPEQPPVIVDTNPDMLVQPRNLLFLDSLPEYTGRVWILENTGPFTGFSVRPVEWYMARHYFPVETLETSDRARLVGFDVNANAPAERAMRWPATLTDASFGGQVALVGVDIPTPRVRVGPYAGPDPARVEYLPGDVVPISLLWRALQAPEIDYNVGLFVVGPSGTVAERHSAPQAGFRLMNTWRTGETVRDNHGLQLPEMLAPGMYEVWVKVYAWQTGEPLPVRGASATADGQAALLATIRVGER